MKNYQQTMRRILGNAEAKIGLVMEDLVAKNNALLKIIKAQENNLNNSRSAMNTLNQMEKILNEMEGMLK